jgi:hypothetical protein
MTKNVSGKQTFALICRNGGVRIASGRGRSRLAGPGRSERPHLHDLRGLQKFLLP